MSFARFKVFSIWANTIYESTLKDSKVDPGDVWQWLEDRILQIILQSKEKPLQILCTVSTKAAVNVFQTLIFAFDKPIY